VTRTAAFDVLTALRQECRKAEGKGDQYAHVVAAQLVRAAEEVLTRLLDDEAQLREDLMRLDLEFQDVSGRLLTYDESCTGC
jgi:hypothetical protein